MTELPDLRRGWCPGALRPMQSGDGLLLRVRPAAGTFSLLALAAIAKTASRFGSGDIDLTNRGNLQLRGISDETYPSALAALRVAGLIDTDADTEAVRNIVVDPLSGLDPERANVRAMAAELERSLIDDVRFWSLPGKFGFSFSGASEPRLGGRPADVMVAAARGGGFALFLGGDEMAGVRVGTDAAEAAADIAKVFLRLRSEDQSMTRMKHAVARYGAGAIFASAGFHPEANIVSEAQPLSSASAGPLAHAGRIFAVGIGLPFGRITARGLGSLCRTASRLGIEAANTGPERLLIFSSNDAGQAEALLNEAAGLELITEAGDPRLAMDVCPGAPSCRNATTETRRDAERLVEGLRESGSGFSSVHVSGCEKGCARRGAAELTLLARRGRYDVICNGGPDGPVAIGNLEPAEIARAIKGLGRPRHP